MDALTAGVALITVQLCIALIMAGTSYVTPSELCTRYWAFSGAFTAVGLAIIILNGGAPRYVLLIIGNYTLIVGIIFQWCGIRAFYKKPVGYLPWVIAAIFCVWYALLLLLQASVNDRVRLASGVILVVFILDFYEVWRGRSVQRTFAHILTLAALGILMVSYTIRFTAAMFVLADVRPETTSVTAIMAQYFAPISGSLLFYTGLLLLYFEKLVADNRDRSFQLEAANQQLARAKAAADEANQAKSAFLSSMSHELRTPLNAILGFAQLLNAGYMRPKLAQQKEYIGYIIKSGNHLLTVINEILDLAKVEAGAVALTPEPLELDEIFLECQAMIEPMGLQRGIRVSFPSPSALTIIADRTRLRQVLLNLLTNAVKYNREAGSVVVQCIVTEADRVRISVSDTGIGLREGQVEELFQPFNRLGQESGTVEGTGIGLVVTKRLVETMGGEIGVISTPDMGSIFWIEFVLASRSATVPTEGNGTAPIVSDAGRAGEGETILYVEDHPANLKLVAEILRSRGNYRLLTASDALTGIEMARMHQPDAILLDINLPGTNGYLALKILRADDRTASIPVIAVTAKGMRGDAQKGIEAGFFRYVTKPIDIAALMEAIDSALAGDRGVKADTAQAGKSH
jgi:signal transduction histidine kinase/ActR/RegA family two-component response regulator